MSNRLTLLSRIVAVSLILASSGILSRASEADGQYPSCPSTLNYGCQPNWSCSLSQCETFCHQYGPNCHAWGEDCVTAWWKCGTTWGYAELSCSCGIIP
jgi:hypothetical protein